MKCDRDCFNCIFEDCIQDSVTKTEREMQDYRDKSIIVTGILPKAHASGKGNRGRKGGRYD